MPVIALSALENVTGGDHELLADLATMFVRLLPELRTLTRLALTKSDDS